jgi:hypothetical protein
MAIRANPNYATAYENLGDVYARLASQSYNKALLLDNGNAAIPPKLTVLREMFKPATGASAGTSNKPLAAASAGASAH